MQKLLGYIGGLLKPSIKSMPYPWYELVSPDRPFEQGDFIPDCPVVIPKTPLAGTPTEIQAEIVITDVVVMSQSCDLAKGNVEFVLACPVVRKDGYEQKLEEIRKGRQPAYHLLNKCDVPSKPEFAKDYLIVDFRNVYSVEFAFLKEFMKSKSRLRLLPPYREHLSQAFARFFMRVGLPSDIPPFNK